MYEGEVGSTVHGGTAAAPMIADVFKEVYLIDNTEQSVREVAMLINGQIEFEVDDCPEWVSNILFLIKKIKNKESGRR